MLVGQQLAVRVAVIPHPADFQQPEELAMQSRPPVAKKHRRAYRDADDNADTGHRDRGPSERGNGGNDVDEAIGAGRAHEQSLTTTR